MPIVNPNIPVAFPPLIVIYSSSPCVLEVNVKNCCDKLIAPKLQESVILALMFTIS